jgi:uncharacterized membrane protein YecN with MAPEG domain
MKSVRRVPALVAGSIVVAVLATLAVPDGWMIWVPIGLALAVFGRICHASGR